MSAPAASPVPLDDGSGGTCRACGAGGGVAARPGASATADPADVGSRPDRVAHAVGATQVGALVTELVHDAGVLTWVCIGAGPASFAVRPAAEHWFAGPLLARGEPVRVVVCAANTGPARALLEASTDAAADSLRVARSGAELGGMHSDLLVAAGTDSVAVASSQDDAVHASAVRGAAINAVIRALVDSLWERALPAADVGRIEAVAHDPVKIEVLALLEAGAKDEAIARALGVSVRTCRRRIAELLSAADAGSRFQAACRFARLGLLPDLESTAAAGARTTCSPRSEPAQPGITGHP